MHYYSLKSRYLRVMLLSLVFLLTAGQLSAKMIYFKNNSNWGNVKAHVWGGWDGDVEMTSCDNGWFKGEINDNAKQILFYTGNWESKTDDLNIPTDNKNAYNNGWTTYEVKIYGGLALQGTDWYTSGWALDDSDGDGTYTYTFTAISGINKYFFVTVGGSRIGDTNNATNKDMQLNTNYNWKNVGGTSAQFYIADDVKLTNGQSYTLTINTKNNTVRIDGEAAPVEKSYQIKHGWNGATDWTWKDLTSNGDGTYSITDYYGGGGCNWKEKNASSDTYIASPTLEGNPQRGDRCTFTLNPTAETITITKKVTKVETPTFSPAGGTYNAAQNVTISCATDGATIYYTTDGNDPTTSSTQYTGAIAVNATTTLKAIAAKDGMDNSEVAEATYTIELPQTGRLYIKVGDGAYSEMDASDGNFTWQGDINNDQIIKFSSNGTDDIEYHLASSGDGHYWINSDNKTDSNPKFGNGSDYIMKNGNGNYTVTVSHDYSSVTFVKNEVPVTHTVKISGGLNIDGNWTTEGTVLSDNNDGIFTYKFTATDGINKYFRVQVDNKFIGGQVSLNLNEPIEYRENAEQNFQFNISGVNLVNGTEYTVVINTNDKTLCVNGATPAPTRKFDLKTVKIFGGVTDDNQWNEDNSTEMTKVNDDVYTWTYTWKGVNNHWSFRVQKSNNSWVTLEKPIEVTPGNPQELVERNNHGDNNEYYYNGMEQGKRYTITLNAFDGTVSIESAGNGIPVYPRGVQSETELEDYDFASNPVVYLMSNMLNNNRVTPEWQMISDGNGNYHLNGFAARTASDYKVRVYTSATSYVESTAVSINCNDGNASLAEGKLYNASVALNEGNYVLTLTEDESANGRMPFISLVGFAMQQDQEYQTPRAFEGHPSDVTTAKGWQEAWLLHDENGKLVKDRQEHVIYNTMWPPKNPVYFTAKIGDEQRTYSSEQMTFKAQNNYVAKKGAEWKAELLAGENGEAYANLGTGTYKLEDDVEYVRYVVPDIWYVGSAKVWTGWNGEAYDNNGWKAMWSHHANWGYSNRKSSDTDGTDVVAEQPYYLSTKDNYNGNFKFDNPTYFKTIEFFYNTTNRDESRLYTTLAFGKAQIEAQSHKDGDKYDHGMYKPTVSPDQGVSVLSYIIRCYDAATGKLVTLNNGIVADGVGDPSNETFLNDREGLAEGKYYYEMEVVFETANGTRTATVRSNPFTIYFPGVYTTETQSYQLLKLASEMNGYNYLTVAQDTEKGAIYAAKLDANGQVTAVAAIPSEQRAAAVAQYENRDNLYTDRVLVLAPVPAQFKLDAEKSSAEMTIVNYSLDETANEFVNPQTDGSMAYVIQQGHMGNVNHKAVMNYTTTVDETVTPKQTMGKEVSTYMVRPNPVAGDAQVSVVREVNGTPLGDKSVSYYKVNASKSFMDPNTMSVDVDYSIAGNTYRVTGDRAERGIEMTNLDPAATSQTMVVVKYRDADGNYTLDANKFAPVEITSSEVAIKEGDRAITDAAITYAPPYSTKWGKLVSAITTFGFSETTAEKIGDTDLAVELYEPKVYVNGGETAYGFYTSDNESRTTTDKAYFTADELREMNASDPEAIKYYFDNGIGKDDKDDEAKIKTVKVTIAPVYPILVDPAVTVTGFDAPILAPALKAEGDDLAKLQNLYGKAAEKEVNTGNDGIVTGINDIASKEVQSVRFVNVAGQMSDKPFEGVNIVVTKYTDGSTQAVKMVK